MKYRYFVTSREMKRYDETTINDFGMPSMVLMERAALAVVEEIEQRFPPGSRVLIAAGNGNNGGDGIAVGRILKLHGYKVVLVLAGERSKCSEETERQLAIAEKYGCLPESKIEDAEYDIIIDAIFGIGLSRTVSGDYVKTIQKINESPAFVCSIDIPSGIHSDTGKVMGAAVKAELTVTFAFEKLGHILYPGCEYAGEVICKDIGIYESLLAGLPEVYSYSAEYMGMPEKLMPERSRSGNKGTFGKVLIIAGSRNMSGACELCARSAYRIGAGMVKVITSEANREILQKNLPEALLATYPENADCEAVAELTDELNKDMEWASCVIIGPGLGKGKAAAFILQQVIAESAEKPLIIDADGLNLLAESEVLKNALSKQVVLTPHIAEFARLSGCSTAQVKEDNLHKPRKLADELGCTIVCKDARTIVVSSNNDSLFISTTGNDGMATAGSGDVLAGIIGGLAAQGESVREASEKGVYIHGLLGNRAAEKTGRYAVMAGDLVEQLKYILADEGTGK